MKQIQPVSWIEVEFITSGQFFFDTKNSLIQAERLDEKICVSIEHIEQEFMNIKYWMI